DADATLCHRRATIASMNDPIRCNDYIAELHHRAQQAVRPESLTHSANLNGINAKRPFLISEILAGLPVVDGYELQGRTIRAAFLQRYPKIDGELRTMKLGIYVQVEGLLPRHVLAGALDAPARDAIGPIALARVDTLEEALEQRCIGYFETGTLAI